MHATAAVGGIDNDGKEGTFYFRNVLGCNAIRVGQRVRTVGKEREVPAGNGRRNFLSYSWVTQVECSYSVVS